MWSKTAPPASSCCCCCYLPARTRCRGADRHTAQALAPQGASKPQSLPASPRASSAVPVQSASVACSCCESRRSPHCLVLAEPPSRRCWHAAATCWPCSGSTATQPFTICYRESPLRYWVRSSAAGIAACAAACDCTDGSGVTAGLQQSLAASLLAPRSAVQAAEWQQISLPLGSDSLQAALGEAQLGTRAAGPDQPVVQLVLRPSACQAAQAAAVFCFGLLHSVAMSGAAVPPPRPAALQNCADLAGLPRGRQPAHCCPADPCSRH